jgi:serine/threonine protein phosphatase PrpC
MALATAETPAGPVAIAVVCDGVSSSPRPDEASLAGAQAGVRVLLESARRGDDPREASVAAVRSAAAEMAGLAGPGGAPSATYVSVVVGFDPAINDPAVGSNAVTADSAPPEAGTPEAGAVDASALDAGAGAETGSGADPDTNGAAVTLCWLGDSRAYWLADSGSERLTTDDSLAQEMIASGLLDEDEAMASPQAHVITRWLGADSAEPKPHVARFQPAGPGVVMVCTDGLWNYLPEAVDLAERALPAAATDPLGTAGELVKFALEAGGMDNITVVLVPFPLRSTPT